MKRGFTIIELLVASLLLGILVTILTMIFNQSSAAWRVGIDGIADLSSSRKDIGLIREGADNAFVYGKQACVIISPWDDDGNLHERAICTQSGDIAGGSDGSTLQQNASTFFNLVGLPVGGKLKPSDCKSVSISGRDTTGSRAIYVNVMSGGPMNKIDHYQAIWSAPDDPQDWN